MLVLSRKLGEKIVIGDNIVVTVVKIDRNQIRIGIEAPHEVPVYREEIAPDRVATKPTDERAGPVALSRCAGRSGDRGRGQTERKAAATACGACPRVRGPPAIRHPAIGSAVTGPS